MGSGSDSWAGELPDGWTWSKKQVPQFEWRCPFGDKCGKNNRLLYKKKTPEDALTAGTWHLFDKKQHSDPPYTWDEATVAANEGVTEGSKEVDIVLNDNGDEVEPPTKLWWDNGKTYQKWGKGNRWNSWGGDCGNNRSRSPWNTSHGSSSVGANNPQSTDVTISRVELDHIIDCISRTIAVCEHCHAFAEGAMSVFENSAKALKECKQTLERFRRS